MPKKSPSRPRIPDSGKRSNFTTGATRDAAPGKGIPSEIPPCFILRLALRYEDGAIKYTRGNWRKGIPLSRYQDGLLRHMLGAAIGNNAEDHLAGCAFNSAGWMWTLQEIEAGRLPASLNDLPYHPDNPDNLPAKSKARKLTRRHG